MVGKLFSNKPDPDIQAALRTLIPPEVGTASEEAIAQASAPRGQGMLDLLGFTGFSMMDAMMGKSDMTATRHGRQVSMYFGTTGMGKPTVITHVTVNSPPFAVGEKEKNPDYGSMPAGVSGVLQGFGPLDKGVSVKGDADGITIERKRSSKDAASSKGTLQWMTDLRLAESLAEAVS